MDASYLISSHYIIHSNNIQKHYQEMKRAIGIPISIQRSYTFLTLLPSPSFLSLILTHTFFGVEQSNALLNNIK